MDLADWFERLIAEFRATGAMGRSNLVLLGPDIRERRRERPPEGGAVVLPFPPLGARAARSRPLWPTVGASTPDLTGGAA